MESPGEYLKRERALRGVPLKRVFEFTRISMKHLEAIEADDYENLPHPTFVKGFIRSYCRCLGVDETDAVLRYELYMKERAEKEEYPRSNFRKKGEDNLDAARDHAVKVKEKLGASLREIFSSSTRTVVALATAGFILIIAAYFISTRHKRAHEAVAPPPEASAPASVPQEKPAETAKPQAAPPAEPSKAVAIQPQAAPAEAVDKRHTLTAYAVEPVWIKLRIDEGEAFDVTLRQGEKISWKAANAFSVLVGNAGGAEFSYDGKRLKRLGRSGDVVNFRLPGSEAEILAPAAQPKTEVRRQTRRPNGAALKTEGAVEATTVPASDRPQQ